MYAAAHRQVPAHRGKTAHRLVEMGQVRRRFRAKESLTGNARSTVRQNAPIQAFAYAGGVAQMELHVNYTNCTERDMG